MTIKHLIVAGLAIVATPAMADNRKTATDWETGYQVLNAVDAAQTCRFLATGRGVEINPSMRALIGEKPSCGAVIGTKAAFGVLHWLIFDHLRDRNPKAAKVFAKVSVFVQGGVVAANMRLVF